MDGKAIHIQEEKAREAGNFLEALKLSDEATLLYQKEGDIVGLSEIQAARFEIFKQLYLETDDRNYLVLGKMAAKSGVDIARKSENQKALSIPLFAYGKALHLKGKHDKAIEAFREAIDTLPSSHQNRPSVLADMKIHLAICEYINGDVSAIDRAQVAISELQNTEEQKYEKDVWISGGYLKLAEAISQKDNVKSKDFLEKARSIIDTNPDLILRKKQLDRLTSKLSDS